MIKEDVGSCAGAIYALLSEKGKLNLRKIGEYTRRRESSIYMSIGWLLRENKILVSKENNELYYELQHTYQEVYY
ncbi:MAG: winged helix-turn-helix domain-containing protein [Bacteroides sp.]|nr:winged helix-turn-helix domain-containing protein [Bacteroides sp.]